MEGKIYQAISAVMDDVGAVGKDSVNQFDKYKFRGIDAVMNALNPAMRKNHVFVTPSVLDAKREERESKNGGTMMYSILTVKYTFYTDDGSYVEAVVIGEAMDRSDKSTNKAMSAAFKYACFQTFCIPTEEMLDSEQDPHEIGEKVQVTNQSKRKPNPVSDEAKNQVMKDGVDPDLLPSGKGVDESRLMKLKAEMERTGVPEKTILSTAKAETLVDMSEATYIAIMNKLAKTADKK